MRLAAFFASPIFFAASIGSHAQIACDAGTTVRDAARVTAIRNELRATSQEKDDIGYDVPASVQTMLPELKDALAQVVRDVIACSGVDAKPAEIEAKLATLLAANAPQPTPGTSVSNGDPRFKEALSFEWSANLLAHVTAPTPSLLQVELSFAISCGNDTMTLIFRREGARWEEAMRWQAAPYGEVKGAFGDGFFTAILMPQPGQWRLVAIHGHPWCTSRFSGFNIDILAPTSDANRPRVIWHTDRGYSRGDYLERLKVLSPDTFEFRNNNDAMEFDPDTAYERTVIYRYRLSGDKVTRLEPIATNGRGFVEEWLTMPWEEAAAQSAPEALPSLRALHLLHERNNDGDLKSYTGWSAGPVRACSTAGRFQVAFDSRHQNLESTKPGEDNGPLLHHYFFIRQVADGYRMESVASVPDPTCKGPDLMHSRP